MPEISLTCSPLSTTQSNGQSKVTSSLTPSDIQAVVKEVCHTCRAPELTDGIFVCLSNRFDLVLGKAVYNKPSKIRRRVGPKYSKHLPEDDDYVYGILINNKIFWDIVEVRQIEIITHETCHLIDFYWQIKEQGYIKAEHGIRWKQMMWACGFPAREAIPNSELGLEHPYKLICDTCVEEHHTTRMIHTRVMRGTLELYCKGCGCRNKFRVNSF